MRQARLACPHHTPGAFLCQWGPRPVRLRQWSMGGDPYENIKDAPRTIRLGTPAWV